MEQLFKELFFNTNPLLGLVLFIIPGFLSRKTVSLLFIRKEQDNFDKTAESILYSIINYSLFFIVFLFVNFLIKLDPVENTSISNMILGYWGVLVISILVGIIFGVLHDKDVLNKILKRGYRNVFDLWTGIFSNPNDEEIGCLIELKDGKRFFGAVSQSKYDSKELYLSPVFFVDDVDEFRKYLKLEGGLYTTFSNLNYLQIITKKELSRKK
jgi:hypothetical protein